MQILYIQTMSLYESQTTRRLKVHGLFSLVSLWKQYTYKNNKTADYGSIYTIVDVL